jgi:hypothetical protein
MWAAINLERPDRTPVAPILGQFDMRQRGVTRAQRDAGIETFYRAARETFDMLGGYDARYGLGYAISSWRFNCMRGKSVLPGEQGTPADFSVQWHEEENMFVEDYDKIINKGWNGFCEDYFTRTGISLEQLDRANKRQLEKVKEEAEAWDARGIMTLTGSLAISCEMHLSLARTLPKFSMDMHRHPQKVKAAMEAMDADFIDNNLKDMEAFGVPWVVFSLERGSGSYWSLKTYEEFFFPHLKKQVEAFVAHGAKCILHFDTDWTKNLPYLNELPANSLICQFDSITDIFKAKEIIGDRICIMGDMPASLLTLGTRDEVVAYCERLVDIVGKDGGFIMSSGCEVPPDAKFENVKAMVDTVKSRPYPRS